MWDSFNHDKIDVRRDKGCGPYIMVEPAKIARVEEVLSKNGIPFKLEQGPYPCVGTPEAAVIELGKEVDVDRVQQVLDSVR